MMISDQKKQCIWVFQQNGSGMGKIQGIEKYGQAFELKVISIDDALPPIIDDADDLIALAHFGIPIPNGSLASIINVESAVI